MTGLLFLAAILLTPLAVLVPYVATGPVLVFVGFLMVGLIKDIDFTDARGRASRRCSGSSSCR